MKLNKENLEKDIATIIAMSEKYHNIIWESQEGQKDHFDNIPKAEQIAIIGIYNEIVNLRHSLLTYQNWFKD